MHDFIDGRWKVLACDHMTIISTNLMYCNDTVFPDQNEKSTKPLTYVEEEGIYAEQRESTVNGITPVSISHHGETS